MAKMLNIGKKFEDFSSLEIAIQQYQKEENVKFFRRSARTIEKAQPRMPYKKLNERVRSPTVQQVATVMKLEMPPKYDDVEYPKDTRRRLKLYDKVPQPLTASAKIAKQTKRLELMRGPELVHNTLVYGDYGIQATSGGRFHFGHLEAIRLVIARKMDDKKMFAVWRIDPPWQPVTKKPLGTKMGGGKGAISKYVVPVKPDRMIIEVGGKGEFAEVKNFLTTLTKILPVQSRIVTRTSLKEEKERNEELEKLNQNPFTFKYAMHNNMLGIDKYLSPYDYIWFGKYR